MKKSKFVKEAEEFVMSILESNRWTIANITKETTSLAIELTKKFRGHYWDNLLAANIIIHGIPILYTENTKDFKTDSITTINPYSD